METPFQAAGRLLAALEEMAAEEAANLRNLDLVEAVQVIERAAPLVERLVELADEPGVDTLRPRIETLLRQRRQSAALIDTHLARLQAEMRRVDEARARLGKVAPAYGVYAGRLNTRLNTAA